MNQQVGHVIHEVGPAHKWHPVYDSIKDWLENEAPLASPLVIDHLTKEKNKPRFRLVKRRL